MPELTQRRRLLVLGICCLSLLIVSMDVTIVNVALPSIRSSLTASVSGLQWTIDAYVLVLASLLMLSGSTGDRIGRRRTFQAGLVLFTIGSLLCSVAPGLGWLIAFRMVQAVGGSMLNPVALSIITNVFTERRERARALGIWAGVAGISLGLGPVIGGVLIETVGWRAIFWINVPIGAVAFVLAARFVPESKADRPRRPDPIGQLLVLIALASLTYAIIEAPHAGWTSVTTVALVVLSVVAVAGVLAYEPRRGDPLLELRFFRSVPFAGVTVIAVCAFAAFAGFLFLNTLYLQEVRDLSALQAGLCTAPLALMMLVFGPLSGRLVAARGPRISLIVAGTAMCGGALMLLALDVDTSLAWVLASYALFGIGVGMVNSPIANTTVSGMPRSQAGVAAAIASTSRQVGAALGVAVVGSVLNSGLHGPIRAGFSVASRPAWWILAGCGLAVLTLGTITSGRWAVSTVERTAHLFDEDPDEAAIHPAGART